MHRNRKILAIVVVATALCADRAVIAAPRTVPQADGLARTLVKKLTTNLRHSVSPAPVAQIRTEETVRPAESLVRDAASGLHSEHSPFQFRLPPPAAR